MVDILCDICAFNFDSNFKECKICDFYYLALWKYGKTNAEDKNENI